MERDANTGRRRIRAPGHATVVAYLALFIALGGTAYAVNTVRSEDIVDGQVRNADLAKGAVTSSKIARGAVGARQLAKVTVQKEISTSVEQGHVVGKAAYCPSKEKAIAGGTSPAGSATVLVSRPVKSGGSSKGPVSGEGLRGWFGLIRQNGNSTTDAVQVWVVCVGKAKNP